MSSGNSRPLTEEQEQLLQSLEQEFKHRYTEKDEGFLATLKAPPSLPPVVADSWVSNRRAWDGSRNRRFQERRRYEYSHPCNQGRRRYGDWHPDDQRRRYGDCHPNDEGRRRYEHEYAEHQERHGYRDGNPYYSRNDDRYRNRHPNQNRGHY